MITLIDGYEVHGNAHDYTLVINTGKKDKKGNDRTIVVGYYRIVSACVVACYKDICRKVTREKTMTLAAAAREFQSIEKRLEDIIPDCFKRGE